MIERRARLVKPGDEVAVLVVEIKITGEFRALMCKRERIIVLLGDERNVVTQAAVIAPPAA